MAVTALSDAELLDGARNGDEAAFTELYVRHHDAARRLAQGYKRLGDPDDLVNGAFERVLTALRRGSGPTDSFRAYLFVTLRRLAMEHGKRAGEDSLDEVPEPVFAVVGDRELDGAERAIIAQAFESLPGPWQTVLWQTAVEGKQPKDFAGAVGMTPNAAAALAYRARERLRQAYLQAHLQHPARNGCEPHRSRLGSYVRGGLSRRHATATSEHLASCEACRELEDELSDVNRMLVRAVAPVFLLASGGKLAYNAGPGAAAASAAPAAASATPIGVSGMASGAVDHVRRFGALAGGAVAAAVAAVALGAVTLLPHDGGPSGREADIDVQADGGGYEAVTAGETTSTEADETTTTTATTAPTTTTTVADPSATTVPGGGATADGTTATTAGNVVDADVGATVGPVEAGVDADVGIGPDGVAVDTSVDLGVNLSWTRGLLGTGTLVADIVNESSLTATDVAIDLDLSTAASISGASTDCPVSTQGLITGVISLLRSVTCPLSSLAGGSSSSLTVPIALLADATATVTVSAGGEVLATDSIPLTR